MSSIGAWLRNAGHRFSRAFRNFMTGRYGTDKLNSLFLGLGLGSCVISMFLPHAGWKLALSALSYVFLIFALFRCFSRNTYKRYQENRKYLMLLERIRDREHRYFTCPHCRQPVRVPRKKGKILITCPKCKEKFTRKT